jgi:hypothetical protein
MMEKPLQRGMITLHVFPFILIAASGLAQCTFDWSPAFSQRGLSGNVNALHVCDLGNGPELYAGGDMQREHNQAVNHIVKWNGNHWEPLGSGVDGGVGSLTSASIGGAPTALYVGGWFYSAGGVAGTSSTGVAKWDGGGWAWIPTNGSSGGGHGLKVWPGPPTLLYGIKDNMLSVTNGGPWVPVVSILGQSITSLEVFDDGTGPAVYIAGSFITVGGTSFNRIAKWNGTSLVPLGTGVDDWIAGMTVFDDGAGAALYVAGAFTIAGGVPAPKLAKWNGVAWAAVPGFSPNAPVTAISAQNYGLGPRLLVSGQFTELAPSTPANRLAEWTGTSWTSPGGGLSAPAHAFAVLPEPTGTKLVVGGSFVSAGGQAMNRIAKWDGTTWHPVPDGNGVNAGPANQVRASAVFDDGNGPSLYLAGAFQSAGSAAASNIVRFDGTNWTPLGSGTNGGINALAIYDDGNGAAMYAGGSFSLAGGVPVNNIAKWDGAQWSALGSGLTLGHCHTLETLTSGPYSGTLAAGGNFATAGGYSAWRVAFWNGTTWLSTWPSTMTVAGLNEAHAIGTFDNGAGPELYAGGQAQNTFSGSACWKYDGSTWSQVGTNVGWIYDFAIFDHGSGPGFYAVAENTVLSSNLNFGQLMGSSFIAVPGSPTWASLRELNVHQDESGSALHLCGGTNVPGWGPASVLRWDGSTFTSLGGGLTGAPGFDAIVHTITSFDDGTGPALFAAGSFTQAGTYESSLIAKWTANRPVLWLTQTGPSMGVSIANSGLMSGHEYYNIFSLQTCGTIGSGPYLGLCATDVTPLLDQFYLPVGALPFHFVANGTTSSFGPYTVPTGIVFDGVTFDLTGGSLGCYSVVRRMTVQ